MRRREAVLLFREICECIPDAFISKISLTSKNTAKEEFELRINVSLDGESFANVKSLVTKRGLNLKEEENSLLIYGSKKSSIEMGNLA